MRKLIAQLLAICIAATVLTSCGEKEPPSSTSTPYDTATHSGIETESSLSSNDIETDENCLTVEITLPASFFEDETNFDADAYAKEQDLLSAVVNEDGSVTVTMTKTRHQALLNEVADVLDEALNELINGETTPYIKDISRSNDFTSAIVKVDREGYEKVIDASPFIIGMSAYYYQSYLEMESRCEITIVDVSNDEIIKTIVYPDDLGG